VVRASTRRVRAACGRDTARHNRGRRDRVPAPVFSGSMDGHIRAFATADGKLL
jgi:hypothetical protein